MKKIVKRNQVIITSLAILIAVAGYLNFADVDLGFKDKEASTDSASILDQVDYDITDESALLQSYRYRRRHDNAGGGGADRGIRICGTGKAFP